MRKGRTHKIPAMIISVCFVLGGTAACESRRSASGYLSAEETVAEYRDEAAHLTLAPGWRWPTKSSDLELFPDKNPDGSLNRYQVNNGRVKAAFYWHCSWGRTFFSADPTQREAARSQVQKLRESALFKWGLVGKDKAYWDRVLHDVENGNLADYQQIIEVNCPKVSA